MTTLVLFGPKLYFLVQKTSRDFVADVVLELDRDGGYSPPAGLLHANVGNCTESEDLASFLCEEL
jgi:hypothetical protein